jgi:hypothetical protein
MMATSQRRSDLDEERLIEKHIDMEHARSGGRADARLRVSGVPIWALVAYLDVFGGDADEVARNFDRSHVEMDAALAYYKRNNCFVDARVTLNEASP